MLDPHLQQAMERHPRHGAATLPVNVSRAGATLLLLLLASAAGFPEPGPQAPKLWRLGGYRIQLTERPITLRISRADSGQVLLDSSRGLPLFEVARGRASVKMRSGMFDFKQQLEPVGSAWTAHGVTESANSIELRVSVRSPDGGVVHPWSTVRIERVDDGIVAVSTDASALPANRLRFNLPSPSDERFLGLGEQYNHASHEGRRVPIWVSEQGNGRADGWLRLPFMGRTSDTYFPVPWYLSTRGHGVLVQTFARCVFELRAPAAPDRVGIEVWEPKARLVLIDGPRPADVLRRLTSLTGRPRKMPDWAFGVWLGLQGGRERVASLLQTVRAAGAPVDAVWVQDWIGARRTPISYDLTYHWTADRSLYPDLAGFIRELHGEGTRFLGYFNPFVEPRFPEFDTARRLGALVKDQAGEPVTVRVATMKASMLDLSNPAARGLIAGYMRQAMEMGMDGWMSDYGEWLPWDAGICAPEGAPLFHNRYPVEWARLNRETCLQQRPTGDFALFSRSGFTGSQRWLDHVWAGDQNTDFGKDDGLPTVFPAGLHLGLSGVGLFHFDAGGYTSVRSPRRPELLMRWVEASAMSPLLRTHEGYFQPLNAQVYSNRLLLDHFADMAQLHRALQPDIAAAALEASQTGLPVMRHLYLMYPEDPATLDIVDQYLIGDRWLAAPVIHRGQIRREVYFPQGRWRHWKSGAVFAGPARHEVEAPIGTPALFEKIGGAGRLERSLP